MGNDQLYNCNEDLDDSNDDVIYPGVNYTIEYYYTQKFGTPDESPLECTNSDNPLYDNCIITNSGSYSSLNIFFFLNR